MAVDSTPTPPKDLRVEPSARAPSTSLGTPTRVGILDLALSPYEMIHTCADYVTLLCDSTYGVSPSYRIEGCPPETLVGSIGSHLEYILTELLKNAFRATVEYNTPKREEVEEGVFRFDDLPHAHLSKSDLPEVVITVGVVKGVLTIRIRDRGGGVRKSSVSLSVRRSELPLVSPSQPPRMLPRSSPTPSLPCLRCPTPTLIPIRLRPSSTAALRELATTAESVEDLKLLQGSPPCRRAWVRLLDWASGESVAPRIIAES